MGIEGHAPKERQSALADEGVKEAIAARNIREEDYPLLEDIAAVPKNALIQALHNFFSHHREDAVAALERAALSAPTEASRAAYALFADFTKRYDPYAARHLLAAMERRRD